jgi:hypothetical protein
MGLFNKKVKMSTQNWCENFYSSAVFSTIRDVDLSQTFSDTAFQQLVQADPTISAVDSSEFADQLLALRLEVIGIAWFIHVKEDFSPLQSECTRLYLLKHRREVLWDMMEAYNQSVAKSSTGGIDSATRKGQAEIAFLDSMRINLFDKWATKVSDPKDAARAANRVGCQLSWKSERTPVYLSFALTDQLKCEINDEARMIIRGIIHGFFDGASEDLRNVKIIS